jgi:hypothetical protein
MKSNFIAEANRACKNYLNHFGENPPLDSRVTRGAKVQACFE